MNNGLLFLGGLLVAILAALFAVPNFIDWNSYRGVFEEEASKVLGRDVRVGGSVNLKILPVPYVRFEKIRIASLSGQTGEPFVRADSFTMWLSAPALLRGVFEASQIELEKPVLTLAVDDQGVGNWTQVELKPGDLPFVPHEVALRSVQITDGAISVYNAGSDRIAAVDGIDGVFSADGLKGPFRYSGSAAWGGADHDVKLATDVPASDGAFAIKLSAHADRSPNVFMLDGRVYNFSDKMAFKGRWSGKIQMPGEPSVPLPGKAPPPLINLTADVAANPDGAKLENLTLALDNAAEPQTISGKAAATWSSSPRLDVTLNSKWLDIDWLAGAGDGGAGFAKLEQLGVGLIQSVAGEGTASAKIDLEQVKIGGENAGGLSIDADRQGNVTHLRTFKVSLPGGSRLDLAGDLKSKAGKFSFSGNGFIGGSSFGRLKAWADKSGISIDISADGPYSAAGKLEIDDKRFFLTEASGDISGRPLAGEIKITNDDRKRTELTLQASDLDTREVFPEIASALGAEFRKSLGLPREKDSAETKALTEDVRLRIIAGKLTNGEDTYHDVDVLFAIEGEKLSLPVAKVTTQNGLVIGLKGSIDTGEKGPVGTIAYDLVAANADAMQDLVRKVGLTDIVGEDRAHGLRDGKIAGLIRLGLRAPKSADVTFDGLLNGSQLGGGAEFDGGLDGWRRHPSRLQAALDAPSLGDLLTVLGRDGRGSQQSVQPAMASLIASGTLASGSQAQIGISSADFGLGFHGSAQWPENSDLALDGAAEIKAGRTDEALALAGLTLPTAADAIPAQGSLDVQRDNKGVWTVATRNFTLGGSAISGRLTARADSGATRIDGDVQTDRVTFPGLLSAVTDASAAVPPVPVKASNVPGQAAPEARMVWPEGLFNFDALGNTNAVVKVSFKSLVAGGALSTGDGSMTVALAPGKLSIGDLSANAAGGRLAGHASFEKVSNGVALAAGLTLDQAKFAAISARGKGAGTFALNAEARAQSPAGLIAVMTGSGTAKLSGAEISGPSPSSVSEVIDDVLGGQVQNDAQAIGDALVTEVGTSILSLGDRDLAISISDGSVKLRGITLDSSEGTLEGTATADIATLGMSASFQVTPVLRPLQPPAAPLPNRATPALKGPLPPAIVLYNGQLDNLAALSVSADVGDLQRELVVRQMERNVEELEQVRRADDERMRLEKERRKKEAAVRAAAQAAQQKAMEQLPPVIPESAGTANPSPAPNAGAGASNTDDFFGTQQPPGAVPPAAPAPDAQSSNGVTIIPEPQNATKPADATANGDQNAAGQPIMIDPVTGLPVPKPAPAVKPTIVKSPQPPKPVQRRTSSDEVMKTLGGFQ